MLLSSQDPYLASGLTDFGESISMEVGKWFFSLHTHFPFIVTHQTVPWPDYTAIVSRCRDATSDRHFHVLY